MQDYVMQRFTQVRDSVFRSHPWNCLQKRLELASEQILLHGVKFSNIFTGQIV